MMPVLAGESFTIAKNHRLDSAAQNFDSLFENDSDADEDQLTLVSYTQPTGGAATIDAAGNFSVIPDLNFLGTLNFEYTLTDGVNQLVALVSVLVVADNPSVPVAQDDAYTVSRNTALDTAAQELPSLLDNDDNPAQDWLALDVTNLPAHGTLSWDAYGHIVYQPQDFYTGQDSFT